MTSVRHLGCPSCGATLARAEHVRTLRCAACGSRVALVGGTWAPRTQVLPRVAREQAVATVRRALSQWPVRDGAATEARVAAADLFWVPWYEFEAVQAGTVVRDRGVQQVRSGTVDWSEGRRRFLDRQGNEVSEADYYRRRPERVVDTAVVLRTHRAEGRAAGPSDWGLDEIRLRDVLEDADAEFVPFGDPAAPPGHVLAPRRGREEAEADVRHLARAAGGLAGAPAEPSIEFLAPDLRYVFVPVWVVRYRFGVHPYAFVVAATDGRVLRGRAPEAPRRSALFLILGGAYLGLPLGKIAAVLAAPAPSGVGEASSGALRLLLEFPFFPLIALAALLAPLALVWSQLRFRGEVVFGPSGAHVEKLARPHRTGIERVVDTLVAWAERLA